MFRFIFFQIISSLINWLIQNFDNDLFRDSRPKPRVQECKLIFLTRLLDLMTYLYFYWSRCSSYINSFISLNTFSYQLLAWSSSLESEYSFFSELFCKRINLLISSLSLIVFQYLGDLVRMLWLMMCFMFARARSDSEIKGFSLFLFPTRAL